MKYTEFGFLLGSVYQPSAGPLQGQRLYLSIDTYMDRRRCRRGPAYLLSFHHARIWTGDAVDAGPRIFSSACAGPSECGGGLTSAAGGDSLHAQRARVWHEKRLNPPAPPPDSLHASLEKTRPQARRDSRPSRSCHDCRWATFYGGRLAATRAPHRSSPEPHQSPRP